MKSYKSFAVPCSVILLAIAVTCSGAQSSNTTYLGVATSPLTNSEAISLGMLDGFGLKVDFVDPDSGAAETLNRDDVLYMMDDQYLVNHGQLSALIRSRTPGDTAKFKVYRNGKPQDIEVKLSEKALPRINQRSWNLPQVQIAPPRLETIREMMNQRILALQDPDEMSQQIRLSISNMLEKSLGPDDFTRILAELNSWDMPPTLGETDADDQGMQTHSFSQHSTSIAQMWTDGNVVFNYSEADGNAKLKIQDADGHLIFDGPVNTDAERQKVPEKYRDKIPATKIHKESSGHLKYEL